MSLFPLSNRDVSVALSLRESCDGSGVELTEEQAAELRAVATSRDVSGAVATRARIVLWTADGLMRKDVGELAGVSLPTVDRWLDRYAELGLAGLEEYKRGAPREQMPAHVPARILALVWRRRHQDPSRCRRIRRRAG